MSLYQAAKYHPSVLDRLVVLYAQFFPPKDVSGQLKKEFGLEVTVAYIKSYVLRPGTAVNRKMLALREQFCKDVMGISISQKAVRLRELERIIRAKSGLNDKESIKALLGALSAAREEIEGSKIILEDSRFKGETDESLRARKLSIIGELARTEGLDLPIGALARAGANRGGARKPAAQDEAAVLRSESDPVLFPPVEDAD